MSSSVAGLRSSTALSKAKPASKKKMVMVTLWWSAAHLIHYSILNPSETITSKKYVQQNQWDVLRIAMPEVARHGNRKGPILLHNQCFRSWTNWAIKFCLICHISPYLSPTNYLFFKHLDNFLQGKCFHKAENAFQECWIRRHGFLWYRNKQIYFLLAKMCWLWWFLFWLIKMCLSLVMMIQNSQFETTILFHQPNI